MRSVRGGHLKITTKAIRGVHSARSSPSERQKQSPLRDPLIEIQLEKSRGDFTAESEWFNHETAHLEVIFPPVQTWMEKRHQLTRFRIYRCDIAAFPGVASETGIRQVALHRRSPMLPADDVIDLVGK